LLLARQQYIEQNAEFAACMEDVLDNLNTHTPKHGSWLNMAKIVQ
jgi:hypothetical protein